MSKGLEILGLIPARGGSKGLPGKNIKPLNGIPLIAHTILNAKKSKHINRLIVATDSNAIVKVAKKYGAETPFLRPVELSSDKSHAFATYKYTIDWLEKNEGYTPDILCVMLCTTPLMSTRIIDNCLEKMLDTDCDWCFSVNEIEHHPYRAMVVNEDKMTPLFDISRDLLWANRQELPKMYRFNGGVIAGKVKHIKLHAEYNIDRKKYKDIDVRCVIMQQDESYDIDTAEDLAFVEMLMKKKGI